MSPKRRQESRTHPLRILESCKSPKLKAVLYIQSSSANPHGLHACGFRLGVHMSFVVSAVLTKSRTIHTLAMTKPPDQLLFCFRDKILSQMALRGGRIYFTL